MRANCLHGMSSLGLAALAASIVSFGFAGFGHGAALVSQTRHVEVAAKASSGTDALKALYRRPAAIPFPKDNPYTPEKAALGKKLYFDTRLSVTSAQSCASCHSPSFGWGNGTFLNDDTVPHNIMSASKGNEFNLGSQAPGSSTDVSFNEVGDVLVICAIHPRMKMTVKVVD